ncbi:MAG: hypothetical protein WCK35_03725 [Chloroflexota bacterium]
MPRIKIFIRFFQDHPILADLLAIVSMVYYAIALWTLAHKQISVLDEGLYLYKGWLFASGRYIPFQPYGVWTNQMPLAFLIPGWVELIFGSGLRTGRMLAVGLGLISLPAFWLTARRLGGRWVGAMVLTALVLNPAATRMYALAASQGLVACILAWTMWFTLGNDRKNWQLFAGGLLAGCTVMVRINLLPILPLLGLYILWARGWKSTCWAVSGMLITFGGVHLVYWPNILKLWSKWLPFAFLKPWFPPKTLPTWNPDNPLEFRLASFFLTFRYHFAALIGSLATWMFWPKENHPSADDQKRPVFSRDRYKIAVFLSGLLIVFFLVHAWAALGNEYCVFCFPTYTAFYASLGLLLVAVTLPAWNLNPPSWRKWLGLVVFLGLLAGMAYSAEDAAENLLGRLFYKNLLALQVPGLHGALLWQVLANKFQISYETLIDSVHTWFPVLVNLTIGMALLVIPEFFSLFTNYQSQHKKNYPNIKPYQTAKPAWSIRFLLVLIFAGSFLAPAPVIAGDYNSYDCTYDVLPSYEKAGAQLAKIIPTGSKIFWAGYSPVTLLSLPQAKIYPAQIHGTYSFRISIEDDALLKYGWWNESLAEKWLNEADFILAEQKNLDKKDWLSKSDRLDNFELVFQSNPDSNNTQNAPQTCNAVALFLYRRK